MKYLLDTCVISEAKQTNPNPDVLSRIRQMPPEKTFISVITLGELTKGVHLLEAGKRRALIELWIAGIEEMYADRILSVTADIAAIWGELLAKTRKQGNPVPPIDGLIAATAIHHGLHLVTRNVADFTTTGALLINPWEFSAGAC